MTCTVPCCSQPKRDSSKRGSMSAEVTNTRQADLNPISVWHQMLAVLMMRGQMQAKQRKTNCCYVVFIIVIVLVTYLLEPSVSHSVRRHRRRVLCLAAATMRGCEG